MVYLVDSLFIKCSELQHSPEVFLCKKRNIVALLYVHDYTTGKIIGHDKCDIVTKGDKTKCS